MDKFITISAVFILSAILLVSFAQSKNTCPSKTLGECVSIEATGKTPAPSYLAAESYSNYLNNLYQYLLGLVGIAALGAMVYGGTLYVAAAGNPSKTGEAKRWITNAILGLFLAAFSFVLLYTINPDLTKGFNLNLLNNIVPFTGSNNNTRTPITGVGQSCTFNVGTPGTCTDIDITSCPTSTEAGHCPGPTNVICCANSTSGTSGTTGTTCNLTLNDCNIAPPPTGSVWTLDTTTCTCSSVPSPTPTTCPNGGTLGIGTGALKCVVSPAGVDQSCRWNDQNACNTACGGFGNCAGAG